MNKLPISLVIIALAMVLGGCTVVLPNGAGAQYHGRSANIGVQLGGQGVFPNQQGLVCPPRSAWDGRGCLVTNPGLIHGGLVQNQNCRNPQQFINGRWLCPMSFTGLVEDLSFEQRWYTEPVNEPVIFALAQ